MCSNYCSEFFPDFDHFRVMMVHFRANDKKKRKRHFPELFNHIVIYECQLYRNLFKNDFLDPDH